MLAGRLLAPGILLLSLVLISSCRSGAPSSAQNQSQVEFEDVAASSGLNFRHTNGATGKRYMPEIVGPGAALFDYDNDGDLDVFLVQGAPVVPSPSAQPSVSRLFRNDLIPSGKLSFTDVTSTSGIHHSAVGMGAATGDIDNDGDLDLLITAYGPNRLYRNDSGRFTELPFDSGPASALWSTSAAFLDYDRDGWLDVFITSYVDFSPARHQNCRSSAGEPDYCGPKVYRGEPSRLFRNLGGGVFQNVSRPAGLHAVPGPGLGVLPLDANADGAPDVYIANDGAPNSLWLNGKNGAFAESALSLGLSLADSGIPRAGMGVHAADINSNDFPDIIVTNLTNEGATLFTGLGPAGFLDSSDVSGINAATAPFTGFGVGWFDAANSGSLDLFIANGAVRLEQRNDRSVTSYGQRNQLLRPSASGKWSDASASAGPALALEEVSRAAVFGDIDNDGLVDILVTNNNGPTRLLLNRTRRPGNWLLVAVDAGPQNRFGDGVTLEFRRQGLPTLRRSVQRAYSYLAANDPRVHVGLGASGAPVTILAHWPDGATESFPAGSLNRSLTIRRTPPPAHSAP